MLGSSEGRDRGEPMMPGAAGRARSSGLAYSWRAFRTGVAFVVFGAGALVVAFLVVPLLRLFPDRRRDPTLRVQSVVHHGFRWFEWFMSALGLIHVSRVGFDRLQGVGPRLVIANHPTLIDVVLLGASLPQADCIVKKAAWRNRYLRGVAAAAGYLPNDEGEALVEACVSRLRRDRTLLMFPEGTRSPDRRLGRLQRGAAHVALRSGVPLLPVVITCDPPTLMKGQAWYDVPGRAARLTLVAQEPIEPAAFVATALSGPAAARRLSREIEAVFLRDRRPATDGPPGSDPPGAAPPSAWKPGRGAPVRVDAP
jgi:1-acyl-sn-glycerol-3-phosphate acyltransferase